MDLNAVAGRAQGGRDDGVSEAPIQKKVGAGSSGGGLEVELTPQPLFDLGWIAAVIFG